MSQIIDTTTELTSAMDTFDTLADRFCRDEFDASDIVMLNPDYSNVVFFGEDIEITIPIYEETESADSLPPWMEEAEDDSEV